MRRTKHQITVANMLLENPDGTFYGYDISKAADLRSGVVYPMLTRLLAAGYLSDGWEDPATTEGRPPRRYYRLTAKGKRELAAYVNST